MKVLGITGGIGSGKSVVSKLLEMHGIPVYNTDKAAAVLSNFSVAIRKKLSERFGESIYAEGLLNRILLASLIFNDSDALAFVNSVIHPAVQEDFLEWKTAHSDCKLAGIESAILFESGLARFVDVTINVSAPLDKQIQRTQKRNNLNREEILNRINRQMSDTMRSDLVDYILINDNEQALIPQVESLLKRIESQDFV
ncbi:MAG: dephospho-CoA kinase [Candidatus Symbiothrix sp.]|jgi:dephospho-CoA kinase|nr:dephospho-CoA kinase [Candidatus Symbiothrix sp.]